MSEFKTWVAHHKALAIGGAVGIVVLLYFILKGGKAQAAPDNTLANYYAAEAASSQSAAGQAVATNELAAQTNQSNTQAGVITHALDLQSQDYLQYLSDYVQLATQPQTAVFSPPPAQPAPAATPTPQSTTELLENFVNGTPFNLVASGNIGSVANVYLVPQSYGDVNQYGGPASTPGATFAGTALLTGQGLQAGPGVGDKFGTQVAPDLANFSAAHL